MNPQPQPPTPAEPFVFSPAAARSFTAVLAVGRNKLSVKIAHAKYAALTDEQVEQRKHIFSPISHTVLVLIYTSVVVDHNLRRKKKPIITMGLAELKLILEESWKNTASSGRNVGIMKGCLALLLCMTGVRPSSIGAIHPEAAQEGKVGVPASRTGCSSAHPSTLQYLRMGDLTWHRESDEFGYVLVIEFHHFKVISPSLSLSLVSPTSIVSAMAVVAHLEATIPSVPPAFRNM